MRGFMRELADDENPRFVLFGVYDAETLPYWKAVHQFLMSSGAELEVVSDDDVLAIMVGIRTLHVFRDPYHTGD